MVAEQCVEIKSGSTLYLVGQYKKNDTIDLQGVFSSEDNAVSACRDATYFVIPLLLDKSLPHDSYKWNGYYPLAT